MKTKMRIDQFLVDFGYFEKLSIAQGNIMAHKVLLNEELITKSGFVVDLNKENVVRIKGIVPKYVSRAGYKLEKIVDSFGLDFTDKLVLDVGSSTGGFTDLALQNNARCVHALDVGTNQLDYRLRSNPKVISIEKTNFRTIASDFFEVKFDIILMDVSFISVTLLLENVVSNLAEDGIFVCLIKPQFEATRDQVDELNAIINNKEIVLGIINKINVKANEVNLELFDLSKAPIKGTFGNQEYVALMRHKTDTDITLNIKQILGEVDEEDFSH